MSRGLQIALVASTLVLVVAVGGIAAYLFLYSPGAGANQSHDAETAEATKTEAEVFYYKPKNFLTDLADKERLRYVDLTIALAMKDEAAVEVAKKIEPQIRDTVLHHVRQQVAANFAGAAGKAWLAETLQTGLSELLKGQLVKVYVTDLVVQ